MLIKNVIILIYLFCLGCSAIKPNSQFSSLYEKDFDDICKRIANLDMQIISPGSGLNNDSSELLFSLTKKYKFNINEVAFLNKNLYNSADTEQNRKKNFEDALKSKHRIIWAMRGGFGTNFIISDLNKTHIPKKKKTIIGFSDITSLNLFVTQKWNWNAIHAPVFIDIADNYSKQKFATLLDILECRINKYTIDKIYPLNIFAQNTIIRGKLTGGNLAIIELSIGTCWEINTNEKILFVEDVHSNARWIYRSMYHLKEIGKLNKLKAIIFGNFTNCGFQKTINKFIQKFASEIDIPVYTTNQFGHGHYNMPIVYNATAVLSNNKMIIELY